MMKKLLSLFAAVVVCLCVNAREVPYTVGSFTTGYYGAVSDVFTVHNGETGYYTFTIDNNWNTGDSWHNYVVIINENGTDKIALRGDNWDNIAGSNDGINNDFTGGNLGWTLNLATVHCEVTYYNGTVYISNTITSNQGMEFHQTYTKSGFTFGAVDIKLTVDLSKLTITEQGVKPCPEDPGAPKEYTYYPTSGKTDFTNGFNTYPSQNYNLKVGDTVNLKFYNYSNKANNWNNWILYGINTTKTEEFFVLRADHYDFNKGGTLISAYNWDTFKDDMDGSYVDMTCTLAANGDFKMTSTITTTKGKVLPYSYTKNISSKPNQIVLYVTGENSYTSGELAFSESVAPVIPTIGGKLVKAAKASYTRNVTSNWGTLVLPFDLAYDADNEDVDVFKLTGAYVNDEEGSLTFTEYESGKIPAGTPVAFKRLSDNTNLTWTGEQTPLVNTVTPTSAVEGFTMDGTFAVKENMTDIFFIAKDEFWRADASVKINPYRAWIKYDGPASAKTIKFNEGGETTGINFVSTTAKTNGIFNLAGQRVENTNTPGIYIINGKKVCVK